MLLLDPYLSGPLPRRRKAKRFNENHDEHGKFASGAGASSLQAEVATSGGFSANVQTGAAPKTGYQVSVAGHALVLDADEFTSMSESEGAATLHEYFDQNSVTFSQPGMAIGGWVDDGQLYLEPSKTFNSLDAATKAATATGQKEIWDNAAGESITTGDTAARHRPIAQAVDRDDRRREGRVLPGRVQAGARGRLRRERRRLNRQYADPLRFNPNHDEKGQFSSGDGGGDSAAAAEGEGAHAVGVSSDVHSQSLHTLTGPQQPGESKEAYNERLFKTGLEHYPPAMDIRNEAHDVRQELGLPDPQVDDFTTLETSVGRSEAIGNAFADAQSDPNDPDVRAAYQDLVDQTEVQWDHLTGPVEEGGLGIHVDFVSPDDIRRDYGDKEGLNPYPTAEAQRNDLVNNHHLAIASISDYPSAYHPLLTNTRGGQYDTFRAVHDAYGHAGAGADFTRHGEYQAWVEHSSMFYGPARMAASTELTGENSFLVTHHEPATHKAALLPANLIQLPFDNEGHLVRAAAMARYRGKGVGAEPEVLAQWGVVNPHNALFGKIVRTQGPQSRSVADSWLRFNEAHDELGRFSTGDGAAAAASDAYAAAALAEPGIRADLHSALPPDGKLLGLNFSVKSEESLERKIEDKMDEGMSPRDAAASIKDSVRFTVAMPTDAYVGGYDHVTANLEARGYTQVEAKNYWQPGDPYQGLNTVWQTESGQKFEVQFHTPESFQNKMDEHVLYQQYRDPDCLPSERAALYDRMAQAASRLPIPPTALSIGQRLFEDRPAG